MEACKKPVFKIQFSSENFTYFLLREYSSSRRNLSSYGRRRKPFTSLVVNRWIPPKQSASEVRFGEHGCVMYSKWGRTNVSCFGSRLSIRTSKSLTAFAICMRSSWVLNELTDDAVPTEVGSLLQNLATCVKIYDFL